MATDVNWRDFLNDDEVARLEQIKTENRALKAEHRRIYDRCRKRMEQSANRKTSGKT